MNTINVHRTSFRIVSALSMSFWAASLTPSAVAWLSPAIERMFVILPITADTDFAFILKQKTTHHGLSFVINVNLFHLFFISLIQLINKSLKFSIFPRHILPGFSQLNDFLEQDNKKSHQRKSNSQASGMRGGSISAAPAPTSRAKFQCITKDATSVLLNKGKLKTFRTQS